MRPSESCSALIHPLPILVLALLLLVEVVAPTGTWAQPQAPGSTSATVSQELAPIQEVQDIEVRSPYYKKWWFWTVVSVVVAGAAIAVASSGNSSSAPAQSGNVTVTGPAPP